jgi:hypothetical protein
MKLHIYLLRIACFASLFATFLTTKASYNAGSFIGYEALDSTHYIVTLTIYRDCNGIPITSATISITGKPGGVFTKAFPLVSSRDITNPFLGCNTQSRCTGSYIYGFQEIVFSDTIDISGGDCTYKFGYTTCCRASSISTGGAAGSMVYNYATVNKCAGINTSPRPTTLPQMLLPNGQDVSIAPTMVDLVDKADSVTFSLAAPLDDNGNAITYNGSYTKDRPFTFNGFPNNTYSSPAGFHLNPNTGEITFRPTKQNEVGIFVIEANEYRNVNGTTVLVGVVRLELTNIIISTPNNKIPKLQTSGLTQSICAGEKTCISLTSSDADSNDSTFVSITNTLPNAVYTDTRSGINGSGELCWTPTKNDVRAAPYLITAAVKDNACIVSGYKTYTFALYVKPAYDTTNHAVVSKTVSCNRVSVLASKDTFTDLSLDWKAENGLIDTIIGDSAVLFFKTTGWNRFAIRSKNANGCLGPYEWDSVFITPLYPLQLSKSADTTACPADTLLLSVTPLNGTGPYKYHWVDAPTANTASIPVNSNKTAYHKVSVADDAGCFNVDSIRIAVSSPTASIGPDTSVCAYTQLTLKATNPSGIAPFRYEWLGIDTTPTITASINKDTSVFQLKFSDSTGCYNIFNKTVSPFKFSASAGLEQHICFGDSAKINLDAIDGKAPFTFP